MADVLHRIRLQHVRCLLACARHGNMRAAAESLAVTQPAVTKTIKELEDIAGQALMVRERHGVRLTPAGEAFVRHARQGVWALEQALGSVTQQGGGVLRIGVLPSIPAGWLARLSQAWQQDVGHGTLRVVSGRNAELLGQLQRGELDAVLGRLAEPDRMMGLRFEPLWAEPLAVAMRPGHVLSEAAWHGGQRWGYPLVLPLPGTAIRQAADDFLAGLDVQLEGGVVETLNADLGRALASETDALWFTPAGVVRDDAATGRLVVRALPGSAEEAIGLFTPARPGQVSGGLDAFVSLVRVQASPRG